MSTRPELPSSGGDYVIRDGVLMPAGTAAAATPDAPPADSDAPAESSSTRKRRLTLIDKE